MKTRLLLLHLFLLCLTSLAPAQENGNLQIHFMSVGQGDGALLVSPRGETVLFDNGFRSSCFKPVSYLQQLGVQQIDYHITSHYHDDHIGCAVQVLGQFPLRRRAYDRGGTYDSQTFRNYRATVGNKRRTASAGTTITLDAGTANPVTIKIVALNGNGIQTTDENDKSLVAVVSFGRFDAVIGGDLSGFTQSRYKDVETSVADDVGQVEVYKVNHHGSRYSTNQSWLNTIKPKIGVISVGDERDHNHPTRECLRRLHQAGVKTYWTHSGTGATPRAGWDIVGGHIRVEVEPNAPNFRVLYNGETDEDTYTMWAEDETPFAPPVTLTVNPSSEAAAAATHTTGYVWSRRSKVYHYAHCIYVHNITPNNHESGEKPPQGKTLHKGCPR